MGELKKNAWSSLGLYKCRDGDAEGTCWSHSPGSICKWNLMPHRRALCLLIPLCSHGVPLPRWCIQVSCQEHLPSDSGEYTLDRSWGCRQQSSVEIPHPTSGSPSEPRCGQFLVQWNGFQLYMMGNADARWRTAKCTQLFHLFYFIFVIYIVHNPGSNYFGHIFL